MHSATQKVKDMASTAKEKLKQCTSKAEEKAEVTAAHTRLDKEIAHERGKAREAEAKAELHREKAEHREETAAVRDVHGHGIAGGTLTGHRQHHQVGIVPTAETGVPTYPTTGVTYPTSGTVGSAYPTTGTVKPSYSTTGTVNPTYPTTGTRPVGEKYL